MDSFRVCVPILEAAIAAMTRAMAMPSRFYFPDGSPALSGMNRAKNAYTGGSLPRVAGITSTANNEF